MSHNHSNSASQIAQRRYQETEKHYQDLADQAREEQSDQKLEWAGEVADKTLDQKVARVQETSTGDLANLILKDSSFQVNAFLSPREENLSALRKYQKITSPEPKQEAVFLKPRRLEAVKLKAHDFLQTFPIHERFSSRELENLTLHSMAFKNFISIQEVPHSIEEAQAHHKTYYEKLNYAYLAQACRDNLGLSDAFNSKQCESYEEKAEYPPAAIDKGSSNPNPEYAALEKFPYAERILLRHFRLGTLPSLLLDRGFRELQRKAHSKTPMAEGEKTDYEFLKQHYFNNSEDQKFRINLYGEGEGMEFGFVDFAVEAQYAQGSYTSAIRPLTSDLQDHSVDQFLLRRSEGNTTELLPEIRRLAKPGATLILITPLRDRGDQSLDSEAMIGDSERLAEFREIEAKKLRPEFMQKMEQAGFKLQRSDTYPLGSDPAFMGFSDQSHVWQVWVYQPTAK